MTILAFFFQKRKVSNDGLIVFPIECKQCVCLDISKQRSKFVFVSYMVEGIIIDTSGIPCFVTTINLAFKASRAETFIGI